MNLAQGKPTIAATVVAAVFDSVERISIEDQMASEMQIILGAYGKIAANRLCDIVPMILRHGCRELVSRVENAIQLSDADLANMMVEDDDRIARVTKATEERDKLALAHSALHKLQIRASF